MNLTTTDMKLALYALKFLNANWDLDTSDDLKSHGITQKYLQDKIEEAEEFLLKRMQDVYGQ